MSTPNLRCRFCGIQKYLTEAKDFKGYSIIVCRDCMEERKLDYSYFKDKLLIRIKNRIKNYIKRRILFRKKELQLEILKEEKHLPS